MEKSSGNRCPACLRETLNIYYEDDSGYRLGAKCQLCGLQGYFSEGKLVLMNRPYGPREASLQVSPM